MNFAEIMTIKKMTQRISTILYRQKTDESDLFNFNGKELNPM